MKDICCNHFWEFLWEPNCGLQEMDLDSLCFFFKFENRILIHALVQFLLILSFCKVILVLNPTFPSAKTDEKILKRFSLFDEKLICLN